MRKSALQPTGGKVLPPEPYVAWRQCRDLELPWWDGGVSAQPHYQLLEFSACFVAFNQWQEAHNTLLTRLSVNDNKK